MTADRAVNRGYNLMIVALLLFPGFSFFAGGLQDNDLIDKLDDIALFGSGLILTIWYLIGQNRFKRSVAPIGLALVSLVVQVAGVILEREDKEAIGNDIGGMFIFIPVVAFAIFQYMRTPTTELDRNQDRVSVGAGPVRFD
jgi:hypothetical protein